MPEDAGRLLECNTTLFRDVRNDEREVCVEIIAHSGEAAMGASRDV